MHVRTSVHTIRRYFAIVSISRSRNLTRSSICINVTFASAEATGTPASRRFAEALLFHGPPPLVCLGSTNVCVCSNCCDPRYPLSTFGCTDTNPDSMAKCGTFDCILKDRHKGLHVFKPLRRCRPRPTPVKQSVLDAEPVDESDEDYFVSSVPIGPTHQADVPVFTPKQAVQEREDVLISSPSEVDLVGGCIIASSRLPIYDPLHTIVCGKCVRVQWSAADSGHRRPTWYKGVIKDYDTQRQRVRVHYRDGDVFWETLENCVIVA